MYVPAEVQGHYCSLNDSKLINIQMQQNFKFL